VLSFRDPPAFFGRGAPALEGGSKMRKLLLASVLVLLFLVPHGASAQSAAAPPAQNAPEIGTAKVLAIGIGAILGAAAAQAIVVGDGVALVGGIAGGVIAAWWYQSEEGGKPAGLRQSLYQPQPSQAKRISLAL
jgi:hypothetical protein